jgi:hypothetical protein
MCKAYILWLGYPEPNPVLIISEVSDRITFVVRTGFEPVSFGKTYRIFSGHDSVPFTAHRMLSTIPPPD